MPTLATLGCGSSAKPTAPDVSTALRTAVEAKAPSFTVVEDGERGHHLWQEEQRFYRQNGYQLVWSDAKRPRGQMEGLIRALRSAGDDGLEPADYNVDELDAARSSLTSEQVDVDLRATYVLRDQPEWTEAKIAEAMQSDTERSVPLKQPLPIYLVYFTAWEENGALQRVPDVYGLDRRHNAATANTQ